MTHQFLTTQKSSLKDYSLLNVSIFCSIVFKIQKKKQQSSGIQQKQRRETDQRHHAAYRFARFSYFINEKFQEYKQGGREKEPEINVMKKTSVLWVKGQMIQNPLQISKNNTFVETAFYSMVWKRNLTKTQVNL